MDHRKYRIVTYHGDAVYEPAEGGYYVQTLNIAHVSSKQYRLRHGVREFRKAVREYSECYGEPAFTSKYCARFCCGRSIGDEIELRLEHAIGSHTIPYYGYL